MNIENIKMLSKKFRKNYQIYNMDVMKGLSKIKDNSIDCVVTSIPYWQLRDYGVEGQIGLETTMDKYINNIISVFDEIYRVLKPEGTVFLNAGDTYSNGSTKLVGNTNRKGYGKNQGYESVHINTSIKKKSKMMIPQRIAIAMIDKGWILRNDIIWDKLNPMPESVNDRFTNNYENIYFFTKKPKYFFNKLYEKFSEKTLNSFGKSGVVSNNSNNHKDKEKMRNNREWKAVSNEKGRNKRCIWPVSTTTKKFGHCATYPEKLVEICLSAGCPAGGMVLDPFLGSGTTMKVAKDLKMNCIGIEIKEQYVKDSVYRVTDLFTKVAITKIL